MMNDESLFHAIEREIAAEVQGFENAWKRRSPLMWLIAAFLYVFNRTFMSGFVTTIGVTTYWPEEKPWLKSGSWMTLSHEYVHAWDWTRGRLKFLLAYLFPQGLALLAGLAVLVFVSKWFLLALLFLGCAAPWPSRGRTAIELRGYAMTIAVEMWATGGIRQERLAEIERQFTGWAYYRMWPETGDVRERLLAIARQVDTGEILKGPGSEPYQDVHRVLDAAGRLAEGR